jgi:glycerol kinase
VARGSIARASVEPAQIAAVGIANQRETALVWERGAGTPVANAIGWQSRITASDCEQLRQLGLEAMVRAAG